MLTIFRRNQSLIVALLLFIILGAIFFPSAGRDDDYIAFWSADALLQYGELINPNGARIEQGSSIGHILLLTVSGYLTGLSAASTAVPLSATCGLLLLLVLNRYRLIFNATVVDYALILTATAFPLLYWSFAGLETAAYSLSLVLFGLLILQVSDQPPTIRHLFILLPASLLIQMLRPEAFFVIGLAMGLFWIMGLIRESHISAQKLSIKTIIQSDKTRFFAYFLAAHCTIFCLLAAFRLSYFGQIFPQPVLSKMTGIFPGLHAGIPIIPSSLYIGKFFLQNLVLCAAIVTLLRTMTSLTKPGQSEQNVPFDFIFGLVVAQLTFILLSGPDWMEGFRFIVPVVPFLALLAASFYHRLFADNANRKRPLIAVLICAQVAGFGYFVTQSSSSIPLWAFNNNLRSQIPAANNYPWTARANTHHIRDIPVAEALRDTLNRLRPVVGERPIVISSYQAGFVLYQVAKSHFKYIEFIDLAGLVDDTITGCDSLRNEIKKIRDVAARKDDLGHIQVLTHLIQVSDTEKSCFAPRPDIIYLMGEVTRQAAHFEQLGYKFTFNNSGDLSLDFGKDQFYGGFLVDEKLFAKAGLEFTQSELSVSYRRPGHSQ